MSTTTTTTSKKKQADDNSEEDYYVLRADGHHSQDVKMVIPLHGLPGAIASASRDCTAATWFVTPDKDELSQGISFIGHDAFINCVSSIPKLAMLGGESALLTGSNDKHVGLWSPMTGQLEGVLDGHDMGIRCACVMGNGDFVTGGWDKKNIVWDGKTCRPKLEFNENQHILCLCPIPNTLDVLSVSYQKMVMRWSTATGDVLQKFEGGHTDAIQAVCMFDDKSFLTAGNDGNIVHWDLDSGKQLHLLTDHTAMVYSVSVNPANQEIVSASEDCTVKVWRNFKCLQTIEHPALVWSVCHLPSGLDIATGSADGYIRIFTKDITQMASVEKIDLLEQLNTVSKTKKLSQKKSSSLGEAEEELRKNGFTILNTREELKGLIGANDGEKKFVRGPNGQDIEVWFWSNNGGWSFQGNVTTQEGEEEGGNADQKNGNKDNNTMTLASDFEEGGGGKQSRKKRQYVNGKVHDYVFDVDIQGQPLKLCYNSGQSVFDAAQMFIMENGAFGVSQMDKEEIEMHIINNIDSEDLALIGGGPQIGAGGGSTGGGGGGTSSAYSAFAKEAEEMRRQGTAGGGMNFLEKMKEMESKNSQVAFSGYAQEEEEARRAREQTTGNKVGSANPSATGGADGPHAFCNQTPQVFGDINEEAVTKKLLELKADGNVNHVVQQIIHHATTDPTEMAAALSSVSLWIEKLPKGSRTAAIDLLRLLSSRPGGFQMICDAISTIPTQLATFFGGEIESDGEKTVTLRFLSNVIALAPALAICHLFSNSEHPHFFQSLRSVIGTRNQNANVKAAMIALIKNTSILLADISESKDGTLAPWILITVDDIFAYVGECLIFDYTPEETLALLTVPMTIAHTKKNRQLCKACVPFGMKSLYNIMKAKKAYGDASVMCCARTLFEIFMPPEKE